MKTELFHYFNTGTDKHHIFIQQDKMNPECYYHLGGELIKRDYRLEFVVIHKEKQANMRSVMILNDNDFARQGSQMAEKIISLLEGSANSVYDKNLKEQKKHFERQRAAIDSQLSRGYDEGLIRELRNLDIKIEAINRKLDGSFYEELPETFKLCAR